MAKVIGVRFKRAGKVYHFDPAEFTPQAGEYVVVETVRGVELGEVTAGVEEMPDEFIVAPLKEVLRLANEEDIEQQRQNAEREQSAFGICEAKILAHDLEMKLVDVEYTFDGSKVIFYFTANGRVDFRELVKDLAAAFRKRIELRQIGVRDEAKMLGGLGPCGRPNCCKAFLDDFHPVSIKMAKEQKLSLNPMKISGLCGRLMCCLQYEQNVYEDCHRRMPRVGREVMTPDGPGTVTELLELKESVRVRVTSEEGLPEMTVYALEEIGQNGETAPMPRKVVEEPDFPRLIDAEEGDGIAGVLSHESKTMREDKPPRRNEGRRRGGRSGGKDRPRNPEGKQPEGQSGKDGGRPQGGKPQGKGQGRPPGKQGKPQGRSGENPADKPGEKREDGAPRNKPRRRGGRGRGNRKPVEKRVESAGE